MKSNELPADLRGEIVSMHRSEEDYKKMCCIKGIVHVVPNP